MRKDGREEGKYEGREAKTNQKSYWPRSRTPERRVDRRREAKPPLPNGLLTPQQTDLHEEDPLTRPGNTMFATYILSISSEGVGAPYLR